MKVNNTNFTLLILAGGEGTRMNLMSKITPKALLSAYDEPLLLRQIRQAKEASIKNIVVTTNPEDYRPIKTTLRETGHEAEVINNPEHSKGSLPALKSALNNVATPIVLMSFADIFFIKNPFLSFEYDTKEDRLGASKAFSQKELSLGGIIFTDNKKVVTEIAERPLKNNKKGYRWNGLALFNTRYEDILGDFLDNFPKDSPEGDFFEYLSRKKDILFTTLQCPDFINVNTPESLITASLYRYAEVENKANLLVLAKKLREYSLTKS